MPAAGGEAPWRTHGWPLTGPENDAMSEITEPGMAAMMVMGGAPPAIGRGALGVSGGGPATAYFRATARRSRLSGGPANLDDPPLDPGSAPRAPR